MVRRKKIMIASGLVGLGVIGVALAQPPTGPMSFFVTSAGSGKGGNVGGTSPGSSPPR